MIPKADLRIDTYTNSSRSQWVRIIHLPTGVVVKGSGLRSEDLEGHLLKVLEALLLERAFLIHDAKTAPDCLSDDAPDGRDPERDHG
jgi:protein subunit release factor A